LKEPTLAPFYACLYPGLCDIARQQGYALAIHGTLSRDVDVIAVPWTEMAGEPADLVSAIQQHASALLYPDLLRAVNPWLTEEQVDCILAREATPSIPERKPHGRLSWSLHLGYGAYIDISVLPRL
jgi:hypothetical protein